MFAIYMLKSTGSSISVAKFWKLLSCFKNKEKKREREEHCNCNVIRIFSDTAHVLRTCAHAIRSTAIQQRCCSNCIRSPVTSVVVKADLKRMGPAVIRSNVPRLDMQARQ